MESGSTPCRKYTAWSTRAPRILSADRRHRKQGLRQPPGGLELPSPCSPARWALTKYASIGVSRGLNQEETGASGTPNGMG